MKCPLFTIQLILIVLFFECTVSLYYRSKMCLQHYFLLRVSNWHFLIISVCFILLNCWFLLSWRQQMRMTVQGLMWKNMDPLKSIHVYVFYNLFHLSNSFCSIKLIVIHTAVAIVFTTCNSISVTVNLHEPFHVAKNLLTWKLGCMRV